MLHMRLVSSDLNGEMSNQAKVLAFLCANIGRQLSIREIMAGVGLMRSPAAVLSCIKHLEERGNIERLA